MSNPVAPVRTSERGRKPSSLRYYQDGPPAFVDVDSWHLSVSGVGVPEGVALTLGDLATLNRVQESRRYVCVCNWSVREDWGGYLLEDVLKLAGWSGGGDGLYLKQISIGTPEKGVYDSTIPLDGALSRRALLADTISHQPLSLERGFPLRVIDFGLYGYKSVKGIGSLEVTHEFELGEWERRAGYELDGQIRPKRYRLCYEKRHYFIEAEGEVTEV